MVLVGGSASTLLQSRLNAFAAGSAAGNESGDLARKLLAAHKSTSTDSLGKQRVLVESLCVALMAEVSILREEKEGHLASCSCPATSPAAASREKTSRQDHREAPQGEQGELPKRKGKGRRTLFPREKSRSLDFAVEAAHSEDDEDGLDLEQIRQLHSPFLFRFV